MIKRVCFFSVGFAFNRLVRLRYYEKIFPKDVEMFLFTTNKYKGREKENFQQGWDLERTKIHYGSYGIVKTPLELRRFCDKNKIERVINIGNFFGSTVMLAATLAKKRDFILNILADVFYQHRIAKTMKDSAIFLFKLPLLFPFVQFSRRVNFTDKRDADAAPTVFFVPKKKSIYLPAPINPELFKIRDKIKTRKKLNLPKDKKIVLFVGRINYLKCSDILLELIMKNPEVHFIVIGKIEDEKFAEFKSNNLQYIKKKSSDDLIDYYNASDLGFCINRGGGGIGLTTEESLACGVPVLVSKNFKLKDSKAVITIEVNPKSADIALKEFFSRSNEEKESLREISRLYIEENYSDDVWKERYLESYLGN